MLKTSARDFYKAHLTQRPPHLTTACTYDTYHDSQTMAVPVRLMMFLLELYEFRYSDNLVTFHTLMALSPIG